MSNFSVKSVRSARLYRQIVDQIRDLITQGQLRPGQQLPSEATLMERFGVGRSTIREAFAVLETLGIIELSQGKGAFVRVEPIAALQLKLDSVVTPDRVAETWDLISALTVHALSFGEHCRNQEFLERSKLRLAQAVERRHWTVGRELTHLMDFIEISDNRVMTHVAGQAASLMRSSLAEKQLPPTCIKTHQTIVHHLEDHRTEEAKHCLETHLASLRSLVAGC